MLDMTAMRIMVFVVRLTTIFMKLGLVVPFRFFL
jgi:hypothetical protein